MVRAVLAGERDPDKLLGLCDVQIQRNKAQRLKESLRGAWAEEHLFALGQALQSWEHYQSQIAQCDQRIEALLRGSGGGDATREPVVIRSRPQRRKRERAEN